jgi:hypothetical protein
MDHTPTLNDLVALVYHDLDATDTQHCFKALHQQTDLKADYEEMGFCKALLPKVQFNPSSDTIANILQYSAKTAAGACYL